MVSLAHSEVEKIAQLAAIAIQPNDVDAVRQKLSNILDLFAQLSAADTEGVEPMAHPLDLVQRLRDDVVLETDQREKFQANAPAVEDGLYLVPKVIE